jgi:hypothetical protein
VCAYEAAQKEAAVRRVKKEVVDLDPEQVGNGDVLHRA